MILPRVAVVGTGRMGGAMVARLREAGAELVVYNRSRERAAATGAPVAETAAEAVAGAEVVLVSLSDDAAVLSAYGDLVAGLRPGTVVVETSTIDPATVQKLAPLVEATGAALIDAPVSGSVPLVERGELTFMVGGAAGALAGARPVLDVLGRRIVHVGGIGSGAVVKLAVNAVVHYKRAAFERPDEAGVAFTLDLVAKDLDLITGLAGRVGAPMDQAETDRRVVREAIAAGLGARDMSALAEFLRGTVDR